ncbi:hypothetical protein F5Y14DRAFT_442642 [Nemania sp. NC0429]|nr:hypothetical protein F5Y14DRAFT_442642 [Nemania sp. NC0429]
MNVTEVTRITNSFEYESSTTSSELRTQPATPEPKSHPTADTTPESVYTTPGARKQALSRRGSQSSLDLETISDSSKAPSTEGIIDTTAHSSQRSIHGEADERFEVSTHRDSRPTLTTNPYQEQPRSPLFLVKSIYHKILTRITLARQRKSRADNARVHETLNLIKSIPTIRRTRVGNLRRRLTSKQYEQVLRVIENPEDQRLPNEIKDRLRFDYTSRKNQFEIRMPTVLHSGIMGLFVESVVGWKIMLKKSSDKRISDAAGSLKLYPELSVELKGIDSKTPDCSIKHECSRPCPNPTLVLEVAWTETKEELRQRADKYIRTSNGEIRTVVAVCMNEMETAERKNERRLEKMYLEGGDDSNESYSYWNDENNKTGRASILVWRARKENGSVRSGRLEEKIFRDEDGNAIESASLKLQLQDFICTDIADSREKGKMFKAPLLEISSEELCECIQDSLKQYRQKRTEAVKKILEERRQKKLKEEETKGERLRQATGTMTREAGSSRPEDEGLLGRMLESGKWFSARIRGKK